MREVKFLFVVMHFLPYYQLPAAKCIRKICYLTESTANSLLSALSLQHYFTARESAQLKKQDVQLIMSNTWNLSRLSLRRARTR